MSILQDNLFILFGVVVIIIAILKPDRKKYLKKNGIKTEGVIFSITKQENLGTRSSDDYSVSDSVEVRFTTKEQAWITGRLTQDFELYYTGQYKNGEKVTVYYDQADPNKFLVDTKQSVISARIFILLAGLLFLSIGIYKLLQ
jgi:hypothetical protein